MIEKKPLFALAVLLGTIVGAGIFGIPYAVAKSGILPGLFYLSILGGAALLLHLFFGEIVLRTKEKHRLIGFAQKYLGSWGKILITVSTIVGLTGVLLAYIVLGGNFLKIVFSSFPPVGGLDSFYFSLIFWSFLSYFIFRGIKLIAKAEILTNLTFFLIIFFIFCFALPKFNLQNFTLFNSDFMFLPYGIILFSLAGWTAVPEIGEILKSSEERKSYKKVIILSTLIVGILYLLFVLSVVGVSGKATSSEALLGLIPFLGQKIIFWGALAATITLADSFLVIALYFRNALIYDYKFPKILAAIFSSGLPLILFLIGFRSFIEIIGFVGTIIGVIDGIVIVLIFRKIKKLGDREPEYSLKIPSFLIYFLIGIFILGAVAQISYFIK